MAEVGGEGLRKEFVDGVVKGFAEASYKFKQACTISSTNAWTNTFYRETKTALNVTNANATTSMIKGIPRGANFPQASVEWTKIQAWVEKYGIEESLHWEDILTDDISVQARTMYRVAEAVTKQVDAEIWDELSESQTPVNINNFMIAQANGWNGSSGAIIDDLMHAKQLMAEDNYDTSSCIAFINPQDHRSIVAYLASKGAQFPSIGTDMATNGRAGNLVGIKLVVSNNVTTSCALVCVPKICATWKQAVPLSTQVITDPYKSVKIRAVEMGVTQLTDPEAVCLIRGTQGPY